MFKYFNAFSLILKKITKYLIFIIVHHLLIIVKFHYYFKFFQFIILCKEELLNQKHQFNFDLFILFYKKIHQINLNLNSLMLNYINSIIILSSKDIKMLQIHQ